MSEPIRILHWGMLGGIGGIEMFIMNVYRNIDRSKVQFDFLTTHNGKIAFEDEIKELGGRIYKEIYSKSESIVKHYQSLDNFFRNHPEFKGIHMHVNNINFITPLKYAKKYNIPIRILHSHNSGNMFGNPSLIFRMQEYYNKKVVNKYATQLFACSQDAGKWMFGNNKFKVINNAIDVTKFKFNNDIRKKKREELNIKNKKVIGFIGRLQYQKNPEFLIEIFRDINKKDKNTVLVIVGVGDLQQKVNELIEEYDLKNNVILLGTRTDIAELLQAFDLFILPSRFEGLGIVLIEAQASGLSCIASADVIPKEVKITNLLEFISLKENSKVWAQTALKMIGNNRINTINKITLEGYNIETQIKILENLYRDF